MSDGLEWQRVMPAGNKGVDFMQEGSIRQIVVDGTPVVFVRKDNEIFALGARCPHAKAPMKNGFLNEKGCIVCPLHRYEFDVKTGKNVSGEGYPIMTYPVEVRENGTYVGLPKRGLFGLF